MDARGNNEAASSSEHQRISSYETEISQPCVICGEMKTKGLNCSGASRHLTCLECFPSYLNSICENAVRLKAGQFCIACPNQVPALGCNSEVWGFEEVMEALTAHVDAEQKAIGKRVLRKYHDTVRMAALLHTEKDDPELQETHMQLVEALNLKCPRCHFLLDPNPDGCMAMTCATCTVNFCFLCLEMSENEKLCHAHAVKCPMNPLQGSFFVNQDKYEYAQRSRKIQQVQRVLSSRYTSDWRTEKHAVEELQNISTSLRMNGLTVKDILAPSVDPSAGHGPFNFNNPDHIGTFQILLLPILIYLLASYVLSIPVSFQGFFTVCIIAITACFAFGFCCVVVWLLFVTICVAILSFALGFVCYLVLKLIPN